MTSLWYIWTCTRTAPWHWALTCRSIIFLLYKFCFCFSAVTSPWYIWTCMRTALWWWALRCCQTSRYYLSGTICLKHSATLILPPLSKPPSRRTCLIIISSGNPLYQTTKQLLNNRGQELCESRGGRPGLSVLTSLTVSVDVKQH